MLYSTHQLPESQKERDMHLQNLSNSDFSMDYLDDENMKHTASIPALETKAFPHTLGVVVRTHLANHMLNEKGFSYKTGAKEELDRIKEQITIYE